MGVVLDRLYVRVVQPSDATVIGGHMIRRSDKSRSTFPREVDIVCAATVSDDGRGRPSYF